MADRNEIGIQVLTSAGNFPSSGFKEFNSHQLFQHVLDQAKTHLPVQNTQGWVARLGDRELDPGITIHANLIPDHSRIAWAPVERGGGAK